MILIHKTSKQSLFEQMASIILSQCLHKADDVFENIQECSCRLSCKLFLIQRLKPLLVRVHVKQFMAFFFVYILTHVTPSWCDVSSLMI